MISVAGSNLFGQWVCGDIIFTNIHNISRENNKLDLNQAKLLHIGWSYNIFQINKALCVTGSWQGRHHQLHSLLIPEDCDATNCCVAGNDHNILITHKCMIWIMNFENNTTKQIKLTIESPMRNSDKVKFGDDNSIIKIAIANNAVLFLTSDHCVYSGLIPSYVDTSHCLGKVIDVQCGYEHCVLLTDVGSVYTWGNGRRLQLGHGEVSNLEFPTEIEALAGIKIIKICAGGWHTLALSESGDVYAWGWNDTGQLGIRESDCLKKEQLNSYSIPTLVNLYDDDKKNIDINIIDIGCGSRHSALMLADNTVWTTGNNKYGQLGLSTEELSSVYHFKVTFKCEDSSTLMCGPWSTVINRA